MDWYIVDKDYIKYLIQFDSRVGYVEYGEKLKLHVGVLLPVNGCHYYVPISSAKPKHQRMSNSLDFHKLQDTDTGYLYAVLNLNNMIPVPDSCITQLKYSQIEQFRSFSNEKEKNDYIICSRKKKPLWTAFNLPCRIKQRNYMRNVFAFLILPSLPDVVILNCWKKNATPI